MSKSTLPATPSKRGPSDSKGSSRAKSTSKNLVGKGIHPMTKKSGSKVMNRNLMSGTDKTPTGKGHNSLDRKYF